jgi:hypothetical protein
LPQAGDAFDATLLPAIPGSDGDQEQLVARLDRRTGQVTAFSLFMLADPREQIVAVGEAEIMPRVEVRRLNVE